MQQPSIKIAHKYTKYHSVDRTFTFAGQVMQDGKLLNPEALLTQLELLSEKTLAAFFESLDGFFSFIWCTATNVYLVSDRLRSYPLFYVATAVEFWVSDDIELLTAQLGLNSLDKLASSEFLQLGYVTGADTTIAGVSQVPAASWVNWNGRTASIQSYFEFLPMPIQHNTKPALKQQLSEVMCSLTRQLMGRAAGRQIVVPLSGGLDSKAILLSLIQAGYTNICCFTFGAANSWELDNARKLCQNLGVTWHPVYYNSLTFSSLRADADFERYSIFVHSGVSVPNIQVFPAVRLLSGKGIIQPDALIIPGHTGDFVSGAHRPGKTSLTSTIEDAAMNYLWQTHYQLRRYCPDKQKLQVKLRKQLSLIAGQQAGLNAADLVEAWNFRERQSKLIVNSNRYYEFFQLDWWMPFWQRDFVHYWQAVPQQYRLNQLLWQEWVNELSLHLLPDYQAPSKKPKRHKMLERFGAVLDYFTDRNRLLTVVPFHRWLFYRLRLTKRSGNLFGYLADKTLSLAEQHRYHKASRHDNGKKLHDS
ncbi:MAG: asparagine synthase [Gammaproteobacteria bacterium]|nr:asparagine synthase [Gammaproteobacteria bacterium]